MDKYFIKIGTNQIYFIYFIYFIFSNWIKPWLTFLNFIEKIEIPVSLYM